MRHAHDWLVLCWALSACGSGNARPVVSPVCAEAATGPTSAAPHPLPSGPLLEIKRSLLALQPIADLPGLESRLYLIEFPPGASAKLHLHGTQCIGYVLEGSFESSFGDAPAVIKHAGEAFVDLPHLPHHFKNADSARPLRFVVAGTFHKDEALFQVVPE